MKDSGINQYRYPNFIGKDWFSKKPKTKLYLVHCFTCNTENHACEVSNSRCAWCGWKEPRNGRKLAHEQFQERQKEYDKKARARHIKLLEEILIHDALDKRG